MNNDEVYPTLTGVLMTLWVGISADYKSRYTHTIWQQFENAIRHAASSTNNIPACLSRIAKKFDSNLATPLLDSLLQYDERTVMRIMREETAYLVALVRLENMARNEERGFSDA